MLDKVNKYMDIGQEGQPREMGWASLQEKVISEPHLQI